MMRASERPVTIKEKEYRRGVEAAGQSSGQQENNKGRMTIVFHSLLDTPVLYSTGTSTTNEWESKETCVTDGDRKQQKHERTSPTAPLLSFILNFFHYFLLNFHSHICRKRLLRVRQSLSTSSRTHHHTHPHHFFRGSLSFSSCRQRIHVHCCDSPTKKFLKKAVRSVFVCLPYFRAVNEFPFGSSLSFFLLLKSPCGREQIEKKNNSDTNTPILDRKS